MTTPRTVLVTGASRGLGRDMALHLAEHGFTVLAGVRNASDAPEGMTPVVFDVTDATSIAAAARQIETFTGDTGLAGLVNNAGIASFRPLEQQPMAEFEMLFRINVFGVQALTQALLPALRRARGRVVNISSGNGRIALPFTGAYSATKFALEAMSDALRMELAPWGMHVIVVEPGAMATDIRLRGVDAWAEAVATLPEADRALYASQYAAASAAIRGSDPQASPVADVSAAVLLALTDPEPLTRYPVGAGMDGLATLAALPDRERDRFAMGVFGLTS